MTLDRDSMHNQNDKETLVNELGVVTADEAGAATDGDSSFRDKWLRAMADADNARRRWEKEKQDSTDYAIFRFAKDLLSVMDALTLAVESVNSTENQDQGLLQGVSLTLSSLRQVFQQHNISEIESLGTIFNPHKHQVLQELDNTEVDPGTILTVVQPGYMLKDRLLRASLVIVSKRPTS